MNFGDGAGGILFFYLIQHYLKYYYLLLFKKNRNNIKRSNTELNTYRKKAVKTLDEQKAFLTKKYPHSEFKFSFKMVGAILFGLLKFIFYLNIFFFILKYLNISISITFAIIMWIIVPLTSTIILTKFNLEQSDLVHFLRWK